MIKFYQEFHDRNNNIFFLIGQADKKARIKANEGDIWNATFNFYLSVSKDGMEMKGRFSSATIRKVLQPYIDLKISEKEKIPEILKQRTIPIATAKSGKITVFNLKDELKRI